MKKMRNWKALRAIILVLVLLIAVPYGNAIYANDEEVTTEVVENQEEANIDIKDSTKEESELQDESQVAVTKQAIVPVDESSAGLSRVLRSATNELDISHGNIVINATGATVNGTAVPGYDNTLVTRITGEGGTNTISVSNITTSIVLDNVNISTTTSKSSPMQIFGNANITLLLAGNNSLEASGGYTTVLRVEKGSSISIDSASGTGSTLGTLVSKSTITDQKAGYGIGSGAGAGSSRENKAGNVTIKGGTVDAKGGVGIGGPDIESITISGGHVTATGINNGAGIGSFNGGHCGKTVINGGTVIAQGGNSGAGIGNAGDGTGGSIEISGNANVTATGGHEGAGIGLGKLGVDITINILGSPIIAAKGSRADIGTGGNSGSNAVINITGGTIETLGSNNGIGDYSVATGANINVVIKNATITSSNNAELIRANNIAISNASIKSKGGISARGQVSVSKSALEITAGGINASGHTDARPSGIEIYESTASMVALTATGHNIVVSDNSDVVIKTNSFTPVSANEISVLKSKLKLESESKSTSRWNYGIKAVKAANFINSEVDVNFTEIDGTKCAVEAPSIYIDGGSVQSNGYLYGNSTIADVRIKSGHVKVTNETDGIYSQGNISLSGGYIDVQNRILADGILTVDAVPTEGTGNAIVFANEYRGNKGVNINKGIQFYNENTGNVNNKYKGWVHGNVTLGHLVEESGQQFTVPSEYTLYIDTPGVDSLNIPDDKKLVNDGTILNSCVVTVEGEFTNSADGIIYNKNLTKSAGAPDGGEFKGTGMLANNGDIQNEIFVSPITLDAKPYKVEGATLSTINNGKTITSMPNADHVYARQGDNALLYNGIIGRDIASEWKYINADTTGTSLPFFTLTYDENHDDAPTVTSIVVGKGMVSEPTTPTRENYIFSGWYRAASSRAITAFGDEWIFDRDIVTEKTTLYAKWEAIKHTVNFEFISEKNPEGIWVPGEVNVETKLTVDEPELIAPVNWSFDGWYIDEECTQKYDFNTPVESDFTLYGKWLLKEPIEPTTPSTPSVTKPGSGTQSGAPSTGDTTQVGVPITFLLLSTAVLAIFIIKKRKDVVENKD